MYGEATCNFLDKDFLKGAQKIRELGRGTYGTVDLINVNGKDYALKMQNPFVDDKFFFHGSNLLYEVDALTKLKGVPNVINFEGICYVNNPKIKAGESLAILMEPMEGNLMNFYLNLSNDCIKILNDFFNQMITATAFFEAINLTHYDIKPQNILFKKEEDKFIFKITDFGLADPSGIIQGREVFSLWYRPPEYIVAVGEPLYPHSGDIWSLGLTILEMIIRKPVIVGSTYKEIINKIISVSFIEDNQHIDMYNMNKFMDKGYIDVGRILKENLNQIQISQIPQYIIDSLKSMLAWDFKKKNNSSFNL